MSSIDSSTQIAALAAWLCTSKNFPYAAKAGEILYSRFGSAQHASLVNIDDPLAGLQRRYHTPIPEAYLTETIAAPQSQRRQHGVYYTPWPLAKYLTRSAQEIVQQEFPDVTPTWLDPACGAGVFFLSLLNDASRPRSALFAWENSPTAAALGQAIVEARGIDPIQFECRNALLYSPTEILLVPNKSPLIIIGNPPYSNFGKRELSPWLTGELQAYRPRTGEKKTNLRDAFLLFLRLAESLIAAQGHGILAMVLSTTFLDAITHSEVRASLLSTFDELRILRLESPDDTTASNLFSIRQATAACLFVRRIGNDISVRQGRIWQKSLQGTREQKLNWLSENAASTTNWEELQIENDAPLRSGAGQGRAAWATTPSAPIWYVDSPSLTEYFTEYVSGIQTKNDKLFLARSRSELETKIRARFGEYDATFVRPILVAPFDPWWVYYDPDLLGRARYPIMRHMLKENLALVFMRQATSLGEYDHFLVTRDLITDRAFHSRWGAPFLAPLYLWQGSDRARNVDFPDSEDWLAFAYALSHSQWYRQTAAGALRAGFPRIPPRNRLDPRVVERLTSLGQNLIDLHAPKAGWLAFQSYDESESNLRIDRGHPRVEIIGENVRISVSKKNVIAEIPLEVWGFRIGGVEVLKRYLLRRRGTVLFEWEIEHFGQVSWRLKETIAIQREIDSLSEVIR